MHLQSPPYPPVAPPPVRPGPGLPAGAGPGGRFGRARAVAAPGAAAGGYWSGTWIAASVLIALIVVRLVEVYAPLGVVRPGLIGTLIAFGLVLMRTRGTVWTSVFRDRNTRLVLAYMGVVILTLPFSIWVGGSLAVVKQMPYFAALFLVIQACAPTRENLDRLVFWAGVSSAAYAVLIALTGIRQLDAMAGGERLATIGTYDSNDLALIFVTMAIMATGIGLRARGVRRLVAAGSVVVLTSVMLLTGSRGGMVALVAGALALLLGQSMRRGLILIVVLSIAAPAAWKFGPETFRSRAATLLSPGSDYNANDYFGRKQIWRRGIGYFLERPLTGLGAQNFTTREGASNAANQIVGQWFTAHNTYVQVLAELGIFGFVAFVWLVVRSLRLTRAAWRPPPTHDPTRMHRPELFAGFVAWAVAAAFLSHAYHYLTFYMFAITTLTGRVIAEERRLRLAFGPPAAVGGARRGRLGRGMGSAAAAGPVRR